VEQEETNEDRLARRLANVEKPVFIPTSPAESVHGSDNPAPSPTRDLDETFEGESGDEDVPVTPKRKGKRAVRKDAISPFHYLYRH
jgi:hypothetical protein